MRTVFAGQLNFFDIVAGENGGRWVKIRQDSAHRVYRPGEVFLVVERQSDGFFLCWRNGIEPHRGCLGTLIHERYVEDADRPFGRS